jgi:hypothetical protein
MNQINLLPPERSVYQAQVYNEVEITQLTNYVEKGKWLENKGDIIGYVLAGKGDQV